MRARRATAPAAAAAMQRRPAGVEGQAKGGGCGSRGFGLAGLGCTC